jgi:hypothetical protein
VDILELGDVEEVAAFLWNSSARRRYSFWHGSSAHVNHAELLVFGDGDDLAWCDLEGEELGDGSRGGRGRGSEGRNERSGVTHGGGFRALLMLYEGEDTVQLTSKEAVG